MTNMTGRERFRAATLGEPVDRVPIWLREGFEFHLPPPTRDDFSGSWQALPEYLAFREFAEPFCDLRVNWAPGAHFNRTLGIPPDRISSTVEQVTGNLRRTTQSIHTPKGVLTGVRESHRGEKTAWTVKYPVESLDDLERLRSVPFEVAPVNYAGYERANELVGDRGMPCLNVSSPWVVFSTCMPFELALMWSASDPGLVHEVLEEITARALACLEAVFARPLDTMANIGGCEQCTPPMMSPDAFAEFVTPYEGRIVSFLRSHGVPVNCHCHGRVSTALGEMVSMGCDSTDPVEPPFGGGDVTMVQARELVGDSLTLCGNLQFDELERSTPEAIRQRVRETIDTGKRRLILSASAGPISRPSRRMLANYRAWIDAALEFGQCD
jgi:hypothetical protein